MGSTVAPAKELHTMRTFTKLFIVAGLAAGLVGGMAGAAPASVGASKKQFCASALKLGQDVTQPSQDATTIPEDTAKDLEKAFNKLSKQAPTKALKTATKNIAKYYGQIADGDSPADISTSDSEKYAKGTAKFGVYLATSCISASIPDVTIPGGGTIPIPGQ
jgi:type II secretory pathway pseudopilin PulG